MEKISEKSATQLAEAYLRHLEKETGCELVFTKNAEANTDGYLFAYDGKRWIENGEVSFALAGNHPFIVRYDSGEIESLSEDF